MSDADLLFQPAHSTPATTDEGARAVAGRATGITVLTPIKPGWTPVVRLVLFIGRNVPILNRALEQLSFIQYARWSVITGVPYNGAPSEYERLRYDYLFFETNFDGTWDEYIDAFAEVIPERMSAIWGSSFGFPGPRPVGPFKDYIHRNDLPVSHYYAACPQATTKMVLSALTVRDRFAKFRTQAARLSDPEDFKAAYQSFLTDIQHHL